MRVVFTLGNTERAVNLISASFKRMSDNEDYTEVCYEIGSVRYRLVHFSFLAYYQDDDDIPHTLTTPYQGISDLNFTWGGVDLIMSYADCDPDLKAFCDLTFQTSINHLRMFELSEILRMTVREYGFRPRWMPNLSLLVEDSLER